jgi:putative cardiolipin synthase
MELHQAVADVLADSPEKAAGLNLKSIHGTVIYSVDQQIAESTSTILIISPYFIPGKATMERLKAAIARGVKITIVTNSLAATDVPLVYEGYKKPRDELLKLGVKIYELSQEVATEHIGFGNFRSQLGRLHAKALVMDGRRVFIGSMNMDGRSAHENTETGIVLESQTIGSEIHQLVDRNIENQAYEVRLVDGQVRWITNINGVQKVYDTEQNVSIWTRLEITTLGPFAPDNLL